MMGRKRKHRRTQYGMPRQATQKPAGGVLALASVQVPDPHIKGTQTAVKRSMQSPVIAMRIRGEISEGQLTAALAFRSVCEEASIGGARAIDYTREPVDGGRIAEPLSVSTIAAARELTVIAGKAGRIGYALLLEIVLRERGLADVAATWPCPGDARGRLGYVKGRFVEAVEVLIDHFGMGVVGPSRARARASADGHTGPAREWEVGRFGDLVQVGAKR